MEENKTNAQPTQEEKLEESPFKEGAEDYAIALLEIIRENRTLRKVNKTNKEIIGMQESLIETYREKDEIQEQMIARLQNELAELRKAHEQD